MQTNTSDDNCFVTAKSQRVAIVDEVYVINLKRRPDRWAKVHARLTKHLPPNLVVTRVDAIDGKDPSNEFTKVQALSNTFLSVLDNISDRFNDDPARRQKWVMILEDDVMLHQNFKHLYNCLLEKLNAFYESKNEEIIAPFVYMGANQPGLRQDVDWRTEQRSLDGLLLKTLLKGTHGAFAILYNVEAIISLLRTPIRQLWHKKPYDNILTDVAANLDTTVWARPLLAVPNLMIADVTDSDLRGRRNQTIFAEQRHWDMIFYDQK